MNHERPDNGSSRKLISTSRRRVLRTATGGVIAAVGGFTARGSAQETSAGEEVWSVESDGVVRSSPTVIDDVVFVGETAWNAADESSLYALDANDGTEYWRFEADSGFETSPTVVDGTVYVTSGHPSIAGPTETVYAIDAGDGTERWRFDETTPRDDNRYTAGDAFRIESSPTVIDGTVYVGSIDRNVYALDAEDGEVIWSVETGRMVFSSPTVVDNTVFVGSDDGNVYALDAASGDERWSYEADFWVASSPTVVGETVYVGSHDGYVHALDANSGDERWSFETDIPVQLPLTAADDVVYAADRGEHVYALDAASGDERWAFTTGGKNFSSPTVVGDTAFVGSGGNVYAINAADGDERWRFSTDMPDGSDPTVVDGVLYIGVGNAVYALDAGVDGSSTDSRVNLGTTGHHEGWTGPQEIDVPEGGLLDSVPGFGAAATLASVGGAAYLLKRRTAVGNSRE